MKSQDIYILLGHRGDNSIVIDVFLSRDLADKEKSLNIDNYKLVETIKKTINIEEKDLKQNIVYVILGQDAKLGYVLDILFNEKDINKTILKYESEYLMVESIKKQIII